MFGHQYKMEGSFIMAIKGLLSDAIAEFGEDKIIAVRYSNQPILQPKETYNVKRKEYPSGLVVERVYDRDIPIRRKAPRRPKVDYNAPKSTDRSKASHTRAKNTLEDLILSNQFQWWGYVSFDPKKHPWCFDLEKVKQKVKRLLKTFKAKHDSGLGYLVVFETTKKGQVHAHMMLRFTDPYKWFLKAFKNGKPIIKPKYLRPVYNWTYWADKYGFTNFDYIAPFYNDFTNNYEDLRKIAKYISKYMLKDNVPQKKRYLVSQALMRPSTNLCSEPDPTLDHHPNTLRLYKNDRKIVNNNGDVINYFNEFLYSDKLKGDN